MHPVLIISTEHPHYEKVIALRQKVLRAPLGLNIFDDDLASEIDQVIFIYEAEHEVLGCVLLQHYDAETFKLRQMAVDNMAQGKQIGTQLVQAADTYAVQLGKNKIILHAREAAIPFYEKQGYEVVGDTFYEVGLPHKKMEKLLC